MTRRQRAYLREYRKRLYVRAAYKVVKAGIETWENDRDEKIEEACTVAENALQELSI